MNIFYLSRDPILCARYHCDRHVVKMVLETAQLLSTAFHEQGLWLEDMYRPTHVNHPCSVWVRAAEGNLSWTMELFSSLLSEYSHRYDRVHASSRLCDSFHRAFTVVRLELPVGQTPPAQAMPEHLRDPDPVVAYRRYYVAEKSHIFTYSRREVPAWIKDPI